MIEFLRLAWIAMTVVGIVLTVGALRGARRDAIILREFNGSVRGVVARAAVRRETFRLGSLLGLLILALPVPPEVRLIAAMSIPVFVLLNSVSDRQMRQTLIGKTTDAIVRERHESLAKMEERLNARADQRDRRMNLRADERAGIASDKADNLREVAEATAVEVNDLHEGTAPTVERSAAQVDDLHKAMGGPS